MSELNEYVTREELSGVVDMINNLQSRVLGIDMCLKGLSLISVIDGGSLEDKLNKAKILKEVLTSLQQQLINEKFMLDIDKPAFFSAAKGIITAIDSISEQLESAVNAKGEKNG